MYIKKSTNFSAVHQRQYRTRNQSGRLITTESIINLFSMHPGCSYYTFNPIETFNILKMNSANDVRASALKQSYDPWALPDSFTVLNFAPQDIHSFLLPHWHTQKAPHPVLYYFFGLYYLVVGKISYYLINYD